MEISQIITVTGQIMAVYTAIKVLQYKQRPSFRPCLCTAIRALLAKTQLLSLSRTHMPSF